MFWGVAMEKRGYSRIKISTDGVFILANDSIIPREFSGTIENISESGMKIVVNKSDIHHLLQHIEIGTVFSFAIVDEYNLFETPKQEIIRGDARIVRTVDDGDFLTIGCRIISPAYEIYEYINNKRTSFFMANLIRRNQDLS